MGIVRPVSDPVIDLQSVSKIVSRGGIHALRGAALQVRAGEIFGLLGPNGAGKSTLVKSCCRLSAQRKAEARCVGVPIGHKPTLARIGYLPEAARFADYLTASQVLDLIVVFTWVPAASRKARGKRLLEITGIAAWANKPLGSFSKGMKQRLGLAQALINDPQLVFLDEPTDGLDPVGRREVATLLKQLRQEGKTVFLNSHLLGEAERLVRSRGDSLAGDSGPAGHGGGVNVRRSAARNPRRGPGAEHPQRHGTGGDAWRLVRLR